MMPSVAQDALQHPATHCNTGMVSLLRHPVLRCVVVCCSVLQCVAVCCSASCARDGIFIQALYAAVCCSVLQCVAVCCSVLQFVAVRWSVFRCVAVRCSALQYFAVRLVPLWIRSGSGNYCCWAILYQFGTKVLGVWYQQPPKILEIVFSSST